MSGKLKKIGNEEESTRAGGGGGGGGKDSFQESCNIVSDVVPINNNCFRFAHHHLKLRFLPA